MLRVDANIYVKDQKKQSRGNQYFREKKYEQAIECYNEIIKADPEKHAHIFYNRAKAYYHLGKYDKAIDSVRQGPGRSSNDFVLGETYLAKKEYELAINCYRSSINENQAEPDCLLSIYQGLGKAYVAQQDYENAIIYYSKYLQYDCLNASVYRDRGLVYLQLKQYDKAIADFNQALKINPKASDIHSYLAKAYDEAKQQPPVETSLDKLQETMTIKIEVNNQLDHLVDEAIFDTMSAYRLKVIEMQYLSKEFPVLVVNKVDQNKPNYFNIDEVSPEIIKNSYDQAVESAKVTDPHKIQKKIADFLSLVWTLKNLKSKGWILEEDFARLKSIALYKELHKELIEKLDTVPSVSTTLSYSDMTHRVESIETVESEFVKQAKEKINVCSNRYELAKTLNRIGCLRENIHEEECHFGKVVYHGNLIEKISFKFLRDPKNKNALGTYTSQMGIRDKVKLLLEESKTHKDEITQKKQKLYEEFAIEEAKFEAARKAFVATQETFFYRKKALKSEKLACSKIPEAITAFRKT